MNQSILDGLDPVFRDLLLKWEQKCLANNLTVELLSGRRTYAEQTNLYAQGRTRVGSIITNARAGYSFHNFGLAIDFRVLVDGKVRNDLRRSAAQIAKSMGMTYGGDWILFPDPPHLEYSQGYPLSYFRNGGRLVLEPEMNITPLERLKRLQGRLERVTNPEAKSILSGVVERLKARLL